MFTCKSSGGFPLPSYVWFIGGEKIDPSYYSSVQENGATVQSNLTYQLKDSHHESVLKCQAVNVLSSKSSEHQLDVKCKLT